MADLTFLDILKEIRDKLPEIVKTNNLFDVDIIDRLESLVDLNLDEITEDIRKGSYLGNRKIDINLALNMVGIDDDLIRLNPDEAESIWTDTTKTVQYDKAIVTFVDGVVLEIPFMFDGNASTVSTHGDLLIQLNASIEFMNKLEDTLISGFASSVTGEIVRLYDAIGVNSNVERITLNAVSGAYKEKNPVYYWLKTTSAFQTIAMRSGDIIALTSSLPKLKLLANYIEQVLEIQTRLPKLIDTFDGNGNANGDETIYNNLEKLISLYSNLTALITVYNDIKVGGTNKINTVSDATYKAKIEALAEATYKTKIETVAEAIYKAKIETVADSTYKAKVETVADSTYKAKVETVADSTYKAKIDLIIQNLTAVKNASSNALLASEKAEEAKTKAEEIMALQGEQVVNTLINGSPCTVTYSATTGKFTFNIPEGPKGERGEAFTVNAIGTFAQRSLYNTQESGFSFLALDVVVDGSTIPHIYFKKTATSGDWSIGIPFGRGEKGDTGKSIVSLEFVSTTDVSGLEGKNGATDTYRFLLSDGTYTNTFVKYNGKNVELADNLITNDSSKALTAKQGYNLNNFINEINEILLSDDTSLSTLQEVVTFIKENRTILDTKLNYTDVKNSLTATDTNKPLSAAQGKILKGYIDNINTLLQSDATNLDTLQEIVDFIELNRATLDTLGISNIAGLQTALNTKLNASAYTAADVLVKIKSVDGEGSGLDADSLDGYHANTSATGNTVALRDSAGDISARLFKSFYAVQTATPIVSAEICFRNSLSDNYLRTMTVAAFKAWLVAIGVDITDTNTWRSITDSVATTNSTISASATAVKTAYDKAVSAYNLANGAVSTTAVGNATAGLSAGSIGTYAILGSVTVSSSISLGATYAGSSLKYIQAFSDIPPYLGTLSPSGTWRAISSMNGSGNKYPMGLYLRIA